MGQYGPLPPKGTEARREFMRMIGRLGGQATAMRNRANITKALTEVVGMIAEAARANVTKNRLPEDIADAISVGQVREENGMYMIEIKVDLGDPNALGEDRQARSSARAYEYGSGRHATKGKVGTYPIEPKEADFLSFEWPGHEEDWPSGPKFIYAKNGVFHFWYVDHPGVKPSPFLAPAVEAFRDELKARLKSAFKRAVIESAFSVVEARI